MTHCLVGKTIISIEIAEDKAALRFVLSAGEIVAQCDAECCSQTWIEHVELPALSFPALVLSVENLDLSALRQDNHEELECLQFYGVKIITDRGEIIIDYRNSSNGYYGGDLIWPAEDHYGGVFGQNNSKFEWRPL